MSNVHIHLHVSNLEASRAFYERFLGAEPVKVKPGYVKFLPTFAPINLALSAGEAGAGKTVDHLGFQVESRDAVIALLERAKGSGLEVREEMDTSCCYANQDKFWVRDPDGVEWEVYHLNYDVDEEASSAGGSTCCTPLAKVRLGRGFTQP
jgi:catechol 2,3-dioxygenase-like lactoylglutathione lyase family enzyme